MTAANITETPRHYMRTPMYSERPSHKQNFQIYAIPTDTTNSRHAQRATQKLEVQAQLLGQYFV